MGDWQAGLDRYLMRGNDRGDHFYKVERSQLCEEWRGMEIPVHIDELNCRDCGAPVGWESHGGTFIEFWSNLSDTIDLCDDCCDDDWK